MSRRFKPTRKVHLGQCSCSSLHFVGLLKNSCSAQSAGGLVAAVLATQCPNPERPEDCYTWEERWFEGEHVEACNKLQQYHAEVYQSITSRTEILGLFACATSSTLSGSVKVHRFSSTQAMSLLLRALLITRCDSICATKCKSLRTGLHVG